MTAMEPTQNRMEQETKAWAKPPSEPAELFLGELAEAFDPVVYPDQLPEHGADGDADDEAERVACADDADDAEPEADERERSHESRSIFLVDLAPKRQTHRTADQHSSRS